MQPTRRSYSKSFKAQVIQECAQPGASIVSIALSHNLNANLGHKWIRLQSHESTALQPAFSPLPVPLAGGEIPRIIIESIDNNWAENQIRPWAFGRKNWLFARSLHSGKRAAAIISLIQSARLNGHDPYAYLKGVLTRLQTQKAGGIEELLPHDWHTV